MYKLIDQAVKIISESNLTGALTGAGISVESGIPDFRSSDGLWSIYDPVEYATISAFKKDPVKVWKMLRSMDELIAGARPNMAHLGMGELERMGLLHFIITQNVDNLHQAGGSKRVVEYHGNSSILVCISCGKKFSAEEKRGSYPPRCVCGSILKPNVVFFGEPIPADAMNQSFQLAAHTEALMVVGTSAVVSPANSIPMIAKQNGAKIIEINKETTHLTETVTDIFLNGEAGYIIQKIVDTIKNYSGKR
ncbi:MAG: NAD-dependent deacylase [Deltaproteobacteria bacterium]|nr:NAD-dependent deacylase [Deltaproteobacteria bacterium]